MTPTLFTFHHHVNKQSSASHFLPPLSPTCSRLSCLRLRPGPHSSPRPLSHSDEASVAALLSLYSGQVPAMRDPGLSRNIGIVSPVHHQNTSGTQSVLHSSHHTVVMFVTICDHLQLYICTITKAQSFTSL